MEIRRQDENEMLARLHQNFEYLQRELGLTRQPVGIKIFFSQQEYEACSFPKSDYRMSYCVYVEKATRGRALKHRLENHYCDGGTTAFHLEYPSDHIESGAEYFSYGLYRTQAAAKRVRDGVEGLYRNRVEVVGIATGPLSAFDIVPDIVLILGVSGQIMLMVQGYVFNSGDRMEFSTAAMQGICSETSVQPFIKGKINVSMLCPSTRTLAKWKEEEMAMGIPFELLDQVVEGIENIRINLEG
ncbi:MAG: DUF169 domain-containing protein [Tissierellia bacterium]|nr:DUF169 domain-containing protein [Tissierellia bacterium]